MLREKRAPSLPKTRTLVLGALPQGAGCGFGFACRLSLVTRIASEVDQPSGLGDGGWRSCGGRPSATDTRGREPLTAGEEPDEAACAARRKDSGERRRSRGRRRAARRGGGVSRLAAYAATRTGRGKHRRAEQPPTPTQLRRATVPAAAERGGREQRHRAAPPSQRRGRAGEKVSRLAAAAAPPQRRERAATSAVVPSRRRSAAGEREEKVSRLVHKSTYVWAKSRRTAARCSALCKKERHDHDDPCFAVFFYVFRRAISAGERSAIHNQG